MHALRCAQGVEHKVAQLNSHRRCCRRHCRRRRLGSDKGCRYSRYASFIAGASFSSLFSPLSSLLSRPPPPPPPPIRLSPILTLLGDYLCELHPHHTTAPPELEDEILKGTREGGREGGRGARHGMAHAWHSISLPSVRGPGSGSILRRGVRSARRRTGRPLFRRFALFSRPSERERERPRGRPRPWSKWMLEARPGTGPRLRPVPGAWWLWPQGRLQQSGKEREIEKWGISKRMS